MSSAQDLFRQKRAEKGTSKPNWKELKAKKLQQQAEQQKKAVVAAAPPSFPKPAAASAASQGLPPGFFQNKAPSSNKSSSAPAAQPAKTATNQLPADFFQAPAPSQPTPAPVPQPSSQPSPSPAPHQTKPTPVPLPTKPPVTVAPGPSGTNVPKGFFADAEADAKVRGEKLPTKQDKEDEFKEFQKMMEEEIKVAAQLEAEETADAAEEKRDREEFEQMMRLKLVHDLRSKRQPSRAEHQQAVDIEGDKRALNELVEPDSKPNLEDVALPVAKRRRVIDVLKEELEGGSESESDDDGDDVEGELLNWRAKTV